MRLLFTVTEAFTVPGRGVVLLPELTFVGDEKFRVGEPLRLRFANGALGLDIFPEVKQLIEP